jgi:hypothetical protein
MNVHTKLSRWTGYHIVTGPVEVMYVIHKYARYNTCGGKSPPQQVVSASYTKQYRDTAYNMYMVRRYHVPGVILGN